MVGIETARTAATWRRGLVALLLSAMTVVAGGWHQPAEAVHLGKVCKDYGQPGLELRACSFVNAHDAMNKDEGIGNITRISGSKGSFRVRSVKLYRTDGTLLRTAGDSGTQTQWAESKTGWWYNPHGCDWVYTVTSILVNWPDGSTGYYWIRSNDACA